MSRVLVVDDDHTVREVVVSYLRAARHDVDEAVDGEQALTMLRDHPADLVVLDLVDAPAGSTVAVRSLQQAGAFRASEVRGNLADDAKTLIALRLNGEPLSIDHGYPARLIAPNRPGVLQTKWVDRIEVL